MQTIWYVHGAGASARSFTWLCEQLPSHHARLFEYTLQEGLSGCIARLSADIAGQQPGIVIGHSLGGLIAAGVAAQPNIRGVVTLCAPFGGLSSATFLAMMRTDQLFRDLRTINPALGDIRDGLVKSGKPHLPIIATNGLPYSSEPNDGVVPVASATAIRSATYHSIPVNHFEVLLAEESVTLITDFIKSLVAPCAAFTS
jgi:pimeloyl-ACP methyl ester carboxylesterase